MLLDFQYLKIKQQPNYLLYQLLGTEAFFVKKGVIVRYIIQVKQQFANSTHA